MSQFSDLTPGLTGHASFLVTEDDTAPHLGSGTIEVLATPMMIALIEAAAVDCVERRLSPGHASLGTQITVSHSAPTPVGARVTATARLVRVDGRTLDFEVEARDDMHEIIGSGTHRRVIVEIERFRAKFARKRD
jgi:predicted thioesterase